jgi:hypothetical protein
MRLLGIYPSRGLPQKKSGPIGQRRDREGACPNRGTGCGHNGPKWRPVVRQGCKGETALCRSKEGKPWDGSDLTIVFQEAVSFL